MKNVEVLIQGKLFVSVNYSELVTVNVNDDATESEIREQANAESSLSDITEVIHSLTTNELIDEVDIDQGDEEYDIQDEDEEED